MPTRLTGTKDIKSLVINYHGIDDASEDVEWHEMNNSQIPGHTTTFAATI
jgi:hypothetical protein